MVQALMRPNLMEFLYSALTIEDPRIQLDQVVVPAQHPLVGKRLDEEGVMEEVKVLVIVRAGDQIMVPSGATQIHAEDILILIGSVQQLKRLRADLSKYAATR